MDKAIKKRSLELVTSHSSGHKLSDQVWRYNVKKFLKYSKNYIWKFMQVNSWLNYSTSICPLESGKCRKEGKKLQEIEYLEYKKSFLDEIKNIFQFLKGYHYKWKNRNLIKNSTHKL